MAEESIQHVSDTAFWVANYRVVESQRKDALFHDPLAAVLSGERGRAIAENMGHQKIMEWTIAMRTHVIDTLIQEEIAKGVDTIINLGAGLDTRPYRLNGPKELQWIEVDFPDMIAFKSARLAQEKPRIRLERIALDLGQDSERRKLFRELNARTNKALILTEGVVPYLSLPEAAALAQDMHEQPHFVLWITDYFSPIFMKLRRQGRIQTRLPAHVPFRFSPDNWEAFHEQNGWVLERMQYLGEVGVQVKRPMPLPFYARLLMPLANQRKREAIRRLTGYALLRRIPWNLWAGMQGEKE